MKRLATLLLALILILPAAALAEAPAPAPESGIDVSYEAYQWSLYGTHYLTLVVTNNSDTLATVNANIVFRDEGGNMVGADSAELEGIDPSCSSIRNLMTNTAFSAFDCALIAKAETYLVPSLAKITYEMNLVDKKAVLSVTNGNEYPVGWLAAHVIFFANEVPLYCGEVSVVNEEIVPVMYLGAGKSMFVEVECYSETIPDSAKVYFTSVAYPKQ